MKFNYDFKGVCSRGVSFELDEDMVVSDIKFIRGCPGNTVGVASLCQGRNIDDVIKALKGTLCEGRPTSCPDQFALALTKAKENMNKNSANAAG